MLFALTLFGLLNVAHGCSRALYTNGLGHCYTGRSMGWFEPLGQNLWAFPAGTKHTGADGVNPLEWESKYLSVVASIKYGATMDGVNEMGLGMNILYLAEAEYGYYDRPNNKTIAIGAYGQFMLDMFATVQEAVDYMKADGLRLRAPVLSNGKPASAHFTISDKTGDSAILEYLGGKLVIHHGKEYTVMTNSPPYDEQIALMAYWNEIGGSVFLPGTHRAADRFARLQYNLDNLPLFDNERESVASIMSLMRHLNVPYGIADPVKPNIASTLWRTIIDHERPRYYFEMTLTPNVIWVDLKEIAKIIGDKPMKLLLEDHPIYAGEVSKKFKVAEEEFVFLGTEEPEEKVACSILKGRDCVAATHCTFVRGSKECRDNSCAINPTTGRGETSAGCNRRASECLYDRPNKQCLDLPACSARSKGACNGIMGCQYNMAAMKCEDVYKTIV